MPALIKALTQLQQTPTKYLTSDKNRSVHGNPAPDHMGASASPPSAAGAPAPTASLPAGAPASPCRTLYLRNLCDKLPKARLRALLHALCSAHGEVAWITAEKTLRLRGQAFVTFADAASATAALRKLQGVEFLSRRLVVAYARAESDRARTPGAQRGAARKARRARKRAPVAVADDPPPAGGGAPSCLLRAEGVRENGEALRERAQRLAGFQEVRTAEGKEGAAVVEFANVMAAAVGMAALDGVVLAEGTAPIRVVYTEK